MEFGYNRRYGAPSAGHVYFHSHLICAARFSDPSVLDECGLDENTKELLISNIKQKLTSQAVKIRADIEVACYGYEGIDAVKAALKAGLGCSTDEIPIKINLIAPPIYGTRCTLSSAYSFVRLFIDRDRG